jgi:tRNA-2-methylthio-N6-dimethylallyladenosine synthase
MGKKYHFWITGCQMNYADARRVASELERLGYETSPRAEDADVIILQTCTVRQQSEDKAYNKLQNFRALKERHPERTLAVMGCVVGVRGNEQLAKQFPFVDVFMEPSTDGAPLISHIQQEEGYMIEQEETAARHAVQDGAVILPQHQIGQLVSAPVAVHHSPQTRQGTLAPCR